jgi:hypothetical protein
MKIFMIVSMMVVMGSIAFVSCGTIKASDARAERIISPTLPGYTCFIVRDDDGRGVGGGCVKD